MNLYIFYLLEGLSPKSLSKLYRGREVFLRFLSLVTAGRKFEFLSSLSRGKYLPRLTEPG